MRFTSYLHDNQPRLGLVDGHAVIDLADAVAGVPSDLRTALAAGVDLAAAARRALDAPPAARRAWQDLTFAPVVPEPGKTICLGLNYFDHAQEGGRKKPEYPWFFLRAKSSLIGHGRPAFCPKVSSEFDYEAELAVIIGRDVPRHVRAGEALAYVFGYACFNDISVRDYQKRTPQWTIGKNFDGTGGFGPWVVTADALPPGATGLRIQSYLNGTVMQDANTSEMIFGVAETIALLAQCSTLQAGDVLSMGTPAGVGFARNPPIWLKPGDSIAVEIEHIGVLSNPVVAEV